MVIKRLKGKVKGVPPHQEPRKFRPRTLKSACEKGDMEAVVFHLSRGADVNGRTAAGHFALGGAVIHGRFAVVAVLLELGADVNMKSVYHWTPLYLAAWTNRPAIAQLLIDYGACLDTATRWGVYSPSQWTPLHVAADRGYFEVVKVLVEAGAPVDVEDGAGRTAMTLARANKDMRMVRYLSRAARRQRLQAKQPAPRRSDGANGQRTLGSRIGRKKLKGRKRRLLDFSLLS